jgi:DNA-binding protein H-NS
MSAYQDLVEKINAMQKEADRLKKHEFSTAVKEAKKLVEAYGITASDLGLVVSKRPEKTSKAVKPRRKLSGTKGSKVPAKYRDPVTMSTWTGRGKAPKWVTEHLSRGNLLETLLIPKS